MRRPIEKAKITPEMKATHQELKAFLKRNPEIECKEIRPIGYIINIDTIPDYLVSVFLGIVNKEKP